MIAFVRVISIYSALGRMIPASCPTGLADARRDSCQCLLELRWPTFGYFAALDDWRAFHRRAPATENHGAVLF